MGERRSASGAWQKAANGRRSIGLAISRRLETDFHEALWSARVKTDLSLGPLYLLLRIRMERPMKQIYRRGVSLYCVGSLYRGYTVSRTRPTDIGCGSAAKRLTKKIGKSAGSRNKFRIPACTHHTRYYKKPPTVFNRCVFRSRPPSFTKKIFKETNTYYRLTPIASINGDEYLHPP